MTASAGDTVAPIFTVGRVTTTDFAMGLLKASLNDKFRHVPRQPRRTDIKKGYIIISEKNVSGIKEWGDGLTWEVVISSKGFCMHVGYGGLWREMWVFEVNGLKYHVISYF
jgi:Gti1/Pac2 family